MYQIIASKAEYTEEKVREALAETHPNWVIESMSNDNGWLVRLREKTADFPFKDDKEDAAEEVTDEAEEATDKAEEKADDAEEKADEAKDDSDDEDSKEEGDGDIDPSDGLDEGEQKDLVGQLNDLQAQLTQLVNDLGGKAQEVADDAAAKDDKIKEIADSVNEVAPPMDDLAGLGDMALDAPVGPGALPPAGGPPKPPRRPGVPSAKRPPAGGRPAPGINAFTHTETVRHPGVDATGQKISIVKAAAELESSEQFAEYEVVSMTEQRDGSFAAKLRRKN